VIVTPNDDNEWNALAQFLHHHSGVQPSADLKLVGWVREDLLEIVVGFSSFLGKTCQMHVAMVPDIHYSPRAMLRFCFEYAFLQAKVEKILGVVNSANLRAMEYDQALGFRELYRLPGLHDKGGDIVLFGMGRKDCRFLREEDAKSSTVRERPAVLRA
jgi:hypothetical protein